MYAKQEQAINLAQAGHNLTITGQAGTGKTFLLKLLANKLSPTHNIALTCTTGLATIHYPPNLHPQTVHQFAGLRDGRYTSTTLAALLLHDEHFSQARQRIISTDILIIDEISMFSSKTITLLNDVCKAVRKTPSHFGGMQVILGGDFFQLKPVLNPLFQDPGQYAFEAEFFNAAFSHNIHLQSVVRQTELSLIKAVQELSIGLPTEQTNSFLKTLSRPLPADAPTPIYLYARNIDVDKKN